MSLRDIVEPTAAALDQIGAKMEAAGIGLHPTQGHVAVLRRMAGAMRADASIGKMPHAFNDANGRWDASADKIAAAAAQPPQVRHLMRRAGIENPVTIAQLDACTEAVDLPMSERFALKTELRRMGWLTAG